MYWRFALNKYFIIIIIKYKVHQLFQRNAFFYSILEFLIFFSSEGQTHHSRDYNKVEGDDGGGGGGGGGGTEGSPDVVFESAAS